MSQRNFRVVYYVTLFETNKNTTQLQLPKTNQLALYKQSQTVGLGTTRGPVKNKSELAVRVGPPRRGGRGVLPYMGYTGMYCCEWYGFQAVYSGIGFIIDQKVWVQIIGYRFLVEDVGLDQGNWELALKNIKKIKSVLFWLGCASDLSSFWKTANLG